MSTSPVLVQTYNLTVSNGAHTLASDSPVLVQTHILTIGNTEHIVSSDGVVLTQQHYLTLSNGLHGLSSSLLSVEPYVEPAAPPWQMASVGRENKRTNMVLRYPGLFG